ncbi:MAG: YkgJ family cysteine cluster protein [Rhodospirillales bacterium]
MSGDFDLQGYHSRIRDGVCDIVADRLSRAATPLQVELILEKAVEFAEEMTADLQRRYPISEPLACSAGCSFCCHNHEVHAAPLEAIRIARYVSTRMTDNQRSAVAGRVAEVMAQKREIDKLARPPGTRRIFPCPLLDPESGLCQVYDVRPLVCRGHNSIDLGACRARHASGTEEGARILGGVVQRTVAQAVLSGLRKAGLKIGDTDRVLDLTRALDVLLASPEAIQEAIDNPAYLDVASARTRD